ncbi:unnamed protein product [Parnassius mnemosyne]|uniref:Reverse transcriptase domain-containing protein n=1 Tax=Parnassius mnemosyne TaxID=213953 RepID=A0AAV1L8E2_9NEOP
MNSTFNQMDGKVDDIAAEVSDASLIPKDPSVFNQSPPEHVTFRKRLNCNSQIINTTDFLKFQDKILSIMENWFSRQDEKMSLYIKQLSEIRDSIEFISSKYEDLHKTSEALEKRISDLESKTNLRGENENEIKISVLESKIKNMEQQSRICNVEINNLPEKRNENLITIIESIATAVKHTIVSNDIVAIHRVPHANTGNPLPKNSIVKFTTCIIRDSFLTAYRKNKGLTTDQSGIGWIKHEPNNSSLNGFISTINFTVDMVKKELENLDVCKGSGPDGIPPFFLKYTEDTICVPLTILYNKCIQDGVFPAIWKTANITPIHKEGSKNDVENYRPISLLSVLSKVFERLVHNVIYPVLHNIIIPEQHGFVIKRSTVSNLLVYTTYLFEHRDKGIQVDSVYTDFR